MEKPRYEDNKPEDLSSLPKSNKRANRGRLLENSHSLIISGAIRLGGVRGCGSYQPSTACGGLSLSGIGKPMNQLFADMHFRGTVFEAAIGEKPKMLLLMMVASGRLPLGLAERRL